jgi:iron complex outermembrane recepter protein
MKELLYHMRSSAWLILFWLVGTTKLFAQESSPDTVKHLKEIVIQAYSLEKPLSEVAASVGHIETSDLTRFSETNLLPAINTIPGVRMEERSPGSYRFSIRGSLLRSPFGVRNVKVYWNGLPFTDGGGNTYLNLIDANAIGSAEVIKGPAGSLYGAGTGGALILASPPRMADNESKIDLSQVMGSYGLRRSLVSAQFTQRKLSFDLMWSRQSSDGYRQNSSMLRDFLNMNFACQFNDKQALFVSAFHTYLRYGTPGGLTKVQYDTMPRQARPGSAFAAGAVEQNAHVLNKTPFIGVAYDREWSPKFSSRLGAVWSKTDFDNPAIRNVETRDENNIGARLENNLILVDDDREQKIVFGMEFQKFGQDVSVYDNNSGARGDVQTIDNLESTQWFVFAQANFELPSDWHISAGASLNILQYKYNHLDPLPAIKQERNFSKELSPRIAILKKLNEALSVYANFSRGYSPPSLAEVRPSTNNYNNALTAEHGNQLEIGLRGSVKTFSFDVSAYSFELDDAIVIQVDADGADYFQNVGKTEQPGIETSFAWEPLRNANNLLNNFKVWNTHSYTDYEFQGYAPNFIDYTGNKLTGVPRNVNTSGIDIRAMKFLYINITGTYVDHTPLNDANTEFASEYFLLGSRLGFKRPFWKENVFDFFLGGDNLLDRKYSLGNDLNAVGGRYYNAAAGVNFYGGLRITFQ